MSEISSTDRINIAELKDAIAVAGADAVSHRVAYALVEAVEAAREAQSILARASSGYVAFDRLDAALSVFEDGEQP